MPQPWFSKGIPRGVTAGYRSGLEKKVAAQLQAAGVPATYEDKDMRLGIGGIYHFRIEYTHGKSQYDLRYKQYPCVMLRRRSDGIVDGPVTPTE